MSKPVYMDFLGDRRHIEDVPDEYHVSTEEARVAFAQSHARWLSVESVTEDANGIYLRIQLMVARALISPRFWLGMLREGVRRLLAWKVG